MKTVNEIKKEIESIKAFGDTPQYTVTTKNGLLHVCQNDGQYHTDPKKSRQNGYATYVGKYTPQEAIQEFNLED